MSVDFPTHTLLRWAHPRIRLQPYCQLPRGKWVRGDFYHWPAYTEQLYTSVWSEILQNMKNWWGRHFPVKLSHHLNLICRRSRSFRGREGKSLSFLNGLEKHGGREFLYVRETMKCKIKPLIFSVFWQEGGDKFLFWGPGMKRTKRKSWWAAGPGLSVLWCHCSVYPLSREVSVSAGLSLGYIAHTRPASLGLQLTVNTMGHTRFPIVEVGISSFPSLHRWLFHFQTVSCFRSTGSMPVPRPVTLILPNYLPHKTRNKRKIAEESAVKTSQLVLQRATEETCEEVNLVTTETLQDSNHDEPHTATQLTVHSEAVNVIKKNTLKVINCEEAQKPQQEQRCKKHSRCHCDLLSLDTRDFFTIKV